MGHRQSKDAEHWSACNGKELLSDAAFRAILRAFIGGARCVERNPGLLECVENLRSVQLDVFPCGQGMHCSSRPRLFGAENVPRGRWFVCNDRRYLPVRQMPRQVLRSTAFSPTAPS